MSAPLGHGVYRAELRHIRSSPPECIMVSSVTRLTEKWEVGFAATHVLFSKIENVPRHPSD